MDIWRITSLIIGETLRLHHNNFPVLDICNLANLCYHLAIYKFLWHVLADEEIKGKQICGEHA
jgi:hypothetical protein